MRNIANVFLLVFCLLTGELWAQEAIPMKTWRSHFNYEKTFLVEKTTSKIFAAASQGLMFFDPEDQSINKLSKVDGLSDVGITALAYNSESSYLALGYYNGNVDIITAEGIQNMPVLLDSKVTENKTVNHVSFYQGNMNLSTDFGLLVLTVENQVIEAYQNLGENGEIIEVRASVIFEDVMYLATEAGILAGALTNGDNLQDFNSWQRFAASAVYGEDMISVATANNKVYAASAKELFRWTNNTWAQVFLSLDIDENIIRVRESSDGLLVLTNQRVMSISASEVVSVLSFPSDAVVNDVLQENKDTIWYADGSQGLSSLIGEETQHIVLDGPLNNIKKLKILDGDVYTFPELDTDYFSSVSNDLGYSVFSNGEWETITPGEMGGFSNLTDVTSYNNQTLLTSFGLGILNADSQLVTDYTNSPLEEQSVTTGNTLVTGLASDQSDQLWVTNFSAHSLLRWNGEEEWQGFDFGSSAASEPTSVAINTNNQVWMPLGLQTGYGVLVYDITGDMSRFVTTASTSLPSNKVNDIAFGREGEVWFATDKGIAYFPFSFGIIEDQTIDVSLPIFDQGILFEDKQVLALAIDGGNRIWVGTKEGLWLFDENISELVEYFTVDNSPLPSNTVIDLAIHPESGELFVVTDQGIVSYRTDATSATNLHQQVKIFPNPVLSNFEGWVGMSGLASDVRIKITTISGQLVREVNAAGGSAAWDVRDYAGRRVTTGVYLVFSADAEGRETFAGKIAVID